MCIRFHPISTVPKTRERECFIFGRNMNLSLKTVLSGSGLRVNEPGSSLKLGLYPHRFLILCTFNSELNCDLYIYDYNSCRQTRIWQKPYHCPGAQLPSSPQPENRLRALLPARHNSGHLASLRFLTGGWGALSCSGVMKWSVVCLIWWETDLCPWSNLSCNRGEQLVLNLILIFDIMQFLNNFVSAAQCLLMCMSSLRILIQWWLLSKMLLKVSLS